MYEVEELGELYAHEEEGMGVAARTEVSGHSDKESGSSGASDEDGADDNSAAAFRSRAPPATGCVGASIPSGPVDDAELRGIQDSLRRQLRAWAGDPALPLDEQRRLVRQLLAQWHPDKNQHISSIATQVFQIIQDEVNCIIAEVTQASDQALKKEAEASERRAQRAAEKSAKASALRSAREDKRQGKKKAAAKNEAELPEATCVTSEQQQEPSMPEEDTDAKSLQGEWSLVVGHGPATTSFLRPWPRSHLTLTPSPIASRSGEVLLFGGEAYDGRELTFFSDMYRVNLHGVDAAKPLPWEKIYSSVPSIPGPEPRSSHQAVAWERHLYVFGGEWSSRDQRRYRQFGDFWRIDVTGGPGTRWELLTTAASPAARSGHRMAVTPAGRALLFGGFTEDKRRRATYLDELHALQLPAEPGAAWSRPEPPPRARGGPSLPRPSARAGGLLWAGGDGAAYVYGGARPRRAAKKGKAASGGDDGLDILEDLWRARLDEGAAAPPPAGGGSGLVVRWEQVEVQGEGPGPRTGLSQCAVSSTSPAKRLIFGGVTDLRLPRGKAGGGQASEVSFFHQDVFLLDCESHASPTWLRLWPTPGCGGWRSAAVLSAAGLPPELQRNGGGVDAQSIVLAGGAPGRPPEQGKSSVPRGRIAAACAVVGDALWVFGGACESGPKQEVTLDDLWRLDLVAAEDGQPSCGEAWECVLPLSDRATVWFDSESDEDDEEGPEQQHSADAPSAIVAASAPGGTLSKKQQKEADKKARTELKRLRQQEKCEEKTSKRDMKKEKQRAQARDAAQ